MDDEEVRPRPTTGLPRPLEPLSIADLEAYRAALEQEIRRVDAELARRRSVRGAAEALFRRPLDETR